MGNCDGLLAEQMYNIDVSIKKPSFLGRHIYIQFHNRYSYIMRSNLNLGYFFNVLLCDFSYCEIVLCAVHGNCQLLIDAVLLHDFIHFDYLI